MKRAPSALAILLCLVSAAASAPPKRPHICGIAYVRILVSNVDRAREFYSLALHSIPPSREPQTPCDWCERVPISVGTGKKRLGPIELTLLQSPSTPGLLSEIAFRTDDVMKLREYLLKNHVGVERLTKCGDDPCFAVLDPEFHRLVFVQESVDIPTGMPGAYSSISPRSPFIHAGIIVHDRTAEDHFYKDILGFHVYWHGGMRDDQTDWIDLQVPDGADWIEFMLNVSPDADKRTRGVMNHIAFGVPDIQAAKTQLIKNGWKPGEEPKIGRDGKWQLNLYDSDDTRVEFMEFTPVQKPCCSEYTGTHPGQKP